MQCFPDPTSWFTPFVSQLAHSVNDAVAPAPGTFDDRRKERRHKQSKIAAIGLFCELTNVSIKVP